MVLPAINVNAVQAMLASGALTVETIKDVVTKLLAMLQSTANVEKSLQQPSVAKTIAFSTSDLSGAPVTEDDAAQWKPFGNFLSTQEVQDRVQQMTEAVAAEKWGEGFAFALTLLSMMGGAA